MLEACLHVRRRDMNQKLAVLQQIILSLLWCSQLKQMVDVGDFVGVRGGVKKTDRGEVSQAGY